MLLSPNALCSIDDVKSYLIESIQGEKNDKLIAMSINGLSQAVERITGRKLVKAERTEFFSSDDSVMIVSYKVEAPPIQQGSVHLYIDPNRVFGPETEKELGKSFFVDYEEGIIRLAAPNLWEAGWSDPLSPFYQRAVRLGGFPRTKNSVKIVYTGGLVVPRPGAPPKPTYSVLPSGSLTGRYYYTFSVLENSTNIESASTWPRLQLDLNSNKVQFVLADPGAGKSIIVYRTMANQWDAMVVSVLAGGSGPIVFTDDTQDSSLTLGAGPFSEGPLEVPEDLRLAVAQQIADWISRGGAVTVINVDGPSGIGSRRYDASQFTDFLKRTVEAYAILR